MFKVLLINPPRFNLARLDIKGNIDLGEISYFPPVGLMYLAAALRKRSLDFEVCILDAVIDKLSYQEVVDKVKDFSPDIIGITAYTYTFYDVWKTASEIKKAAARIPIIVGGPHMYIFAAETMTHPCFDYGVAGDGEEVFADLCEALSKRKEIISAAGLLFRGGTQVCAGDNAILDDLDAIPIPAIDLINPFAYYSTIGKSLAVGTICTSRGCPFRCTFCQVPHRKYRMRSIGNIIEEIGLYVRKGIADFFFFDDLFNVNKGRVVELSEEILRHNLKVGWMFRGRIDQIDAPTLKVARRAGCHTISVGIEDATDDGLKAIKKNITIAQAFETVRLIRKNGIRCSTNWMIGFPHQKSITDLQNLLQTAIKMDADYAQFSILQCLPGSELYDQAVAEGGINPQAWREYVLHPLESFSPPIWEKCLTKGELFSFYEYSYRRYYLRPKVILREISRICSYTELIRKANSFRTIFINKYIRYA